jgi:predicted nucleic-acid-binding Zn-ribbon protein
MYDSLIDQCPKCKSFDVSVDLLTNKISCSKCTYTGFSKKISMEDMIQSRQEKPKPATSGPSLISQIKR